LIVDAAVPISRYPEIDVFSQKMVDELGAIGYVFGHAGDGNLHVVLVGNPANTGEWSKLETIIHAIVEKAVQVGAPARANMGWALASANSCSLSMATATILCA